MQHGRVSSILPGLIVLVCGVLPNVCVCVCHTV